MTRLKIKVQPTLCLAYDTKDKGDFFFVICRRGLSVLLDRKLIAGEEFLISVEVKPILADPSC